MQPIQHWRRLLDYLERLDISSTVHTVAFLSPSSLYPKIKGYSLPESYGELIRHYHFQTLFIDDDICLGFLPIEQAQSHPLYALGVYPFAICNAEASIVVAFVRESNDWSVVAFEGLEPIDREGNFAQWIGMQVSQFLRQLLHYNITEIKKAQNEMRIPVDDDIPLDPLRILEPTKWSKTS